MSQYDKISVRDFIQDVDMGAFQVERGVTQRLSFTVVLEIEPHDGAQNDDVDEIISYDLITEAIVYQLNVERLNLLETLAERIAQQVLRPKGAYRVRVLIEKLDRIPGALGVEIVRRSQDYATTDEGQSELNAVLVVVPDGTDPAKLSQLMSHDRSVLLCFDRAYQNTGFAPAISKNLALLDLDKAAWAASDTRDLGDVVATRTEIDWALKNKDICIWAPFRLTADADIASASMTDCAKWLSQDLGLQIMPLGEDL